MARAMYPHELGDPDFAWLLSSFLEQHPNYYQIDISCLPVVLLEGQIIPGTSLPQPQEPTELPEDQDLAPVVPSGRMPGEEV